MYRVWMRRKLAVYIQLSFLFLGALYLLLKYDQLPYPDTTQWWLSYDETAVPVSSSEPNASPVSVADDPKETSAAGDRITGDKVYGEYSDEYYQEDNGDDTKPKEAEAGSNSTSSPTKEELLVAKAHSFIPSILDPNDTSIDRMSCPRINETRYNYLKVSKWDRERKHQYFFALNLRKCVHLLPRLLGSVIEAVNFLGPQNCAVSIVEGNSGDGTFEVLDLLKKEFERMGTTYYLRSSALDPASGKRIEKLAMLRAMAVEPITGVTVPDVYTDDEDETPAAPSVANGTDTETKRAKPSPSPTKATKSPGPPTPTQTPIPALPLATDATVLFLNDVAACAEDILELVHQKRLQSADMTCAMDWYHPGPDALFYDVWVSRAINGDTFFDIPAATGGWDNALDLFPNEPVARARLAARRAFQVFACWNGAVAFTAAPVVEGGVVFRSSRPGECFQGEPQLFCKDMWWRGYGKIAVVPSVNLEYTDELGRRTKREKGYVSEWVAREAVMGGDEPPVEIEWQVEPPEMVKCMPDFKVQSWLAWNESLVL